MHFFSALVGWIDLKNVTIWQIKRYAKLCKRLCHKHDQYDKEHCSWSISKVWFKYCPKCILKVFHCHLTLFRCTSSSPDVSFVNISTLWCLFFQESPLHQDLSITQNLWWHFGLMHSQFYAPFPKRIHPEPFVYSKPTLFRSFRLSLLILFQLALTSAFMCHLRCNKMIRAHFWFAMS